MTCRFLLTSVQNLAPDTTVASCQVLTFLGIMLDAERQETRLPHDKLIKGRLLLAEFHRKRMVTLTKLQSLLGDLNFLSTVVPGRACFKMIAKYDHYIPET